MNNLSLCMIVKNEIDFISRCLRSVEGLIEKDNICVVDHHSDDGTYETLIDRRYSVIREFWRNDFSYARNISLEMAETDWILVLDADEYLPDESKILIERLISNPPQAQYPCFQLKIVNELSDGDVTEHFMTRLFPNHEKIRFQGAIHEQLVGNGVEITNFMSSEIKIMHSGYLDEVIQAKNKVKRTIDILTAIENPSVFDDYNLANAYFTDRDIESALNAYLRVINRSRIEGLKYDWVDHAYCSAIELMVQTDKLDEAADLAATAPDTIVNRPDYWVCLGDLRCKTGDYDIAIGAYERAIAMNGKPLLLTSNSKYTTWRPYAGLGNVYSLLENNFFAQMNYRKAFEFNPNNKALREIVENAKGHQF